MINIQKLTEEVETISTAYARQFDIQRDDNWFILKLNEEMGELTQSYLKLSGQARVNGLDDSTLRAQFEDEVADVLGQLLLLTKHFEVNLADAIQRKWLIWLPDEADV